MSDNECELHEGDIIFIMDAKLNIDKGDHAFSILEELDAMRKDGERCDFKVKLGEDTMDAHRTVLSASSKYFKAMMSHDTLESRSGVVEFKDCDLESVRKCIDFIYTGEVYVEEENCEKLMHVAHMMQLNKICNGIGEFLLDNMTPGSFFGVKKLAQTYECVEIDSKCDQFALENLGALSETEDFQNLEKEYILFLITSKKNLYSENAKCKILIRWINSRPDERRGVFVEMLKQLNIPQMSVEYKSHLVQNEPLVSNSLESVRLFYCDMMGHVVSNTTDITLRSSVTPRNRIGVFTYGTNTLQAFDPATNTWDKVMAVDSGKVNCARNAVALHEHVYMFGSSFRINPVHRFDPKREDSWENLPEAGDNFQAHSVVACGDFIYRFQTDNGSYKRLVRKFNPLEKKWTSIHEGKTDSEEASYVACQKFIYSVGGTALPPRVRCNKCPRWRKEAEKSVERFDTVTKSWGIVQPMNYPRERPAVVEHNNKIYALGGFSDGSRVSHVECYDPADDTWTTMSEMLESRSKFKALALSGKIYILEGQKMEVLDIEQDTWGYGPRMDDFNIRQDLSVLI